VIRLRQRKPYQTERVRTVLVLSLIYWVGLFSAFAQPDAEGDVQKGHQLAAAICAICHVAAADQPYPPIMKPPAPSFASIAQRTDAEALTKFIATTHRGLDTPKGMPNPELMDYQVKQVVAYILSLRK
jgi:mono/diheme cytochrome c family protein